MVTLYNVVSADGFVARVDGDEDFIPDELWNDFIALCRQHDVVVMGRKTYEAIQEYPPELVAEFERLPTKRVVISRNLALTPKSGYAITRSLGEAVRVGERVLISSGPTINDLAVREGLVDRVIWQVLPVKIGSGLRAFNVESNLKLLSKEDRPGGLKWRVYKAFR
jgi:dihydrofolate reductase